MRIQLAVVPSLLLAILTAHQAALAQAPLPIYTDNLVNGFQDWSWASRNLANTTPVHSGSRSISVTDVAWTALSFQHPDFNVTPYTNLVFWAHGGTSGGQVLQVYIQYGNGSQGASVALSALSANTWKQYTVSLSSLGVANMTNVNRVNIQLTASGTTGTFYVDDITITAAKAPALVHLNVNAAQTLRTADSRWFGLNSAIWDSNFDTSSTSNSLKELGTRMLRLPGGSLSDEFHWGTGKSGTNTWMWATTWPNFMHIITNTGVKAMITVNYGTGTSNEAAGWVRSANITNSVNCKYWEIGNECYGLWETDSNSLPHDPYTYATRAVGYIAMMKAADPTIKIGVVATPGESSYSNNATHFAVNPRTGTTNYGWTPVMLARLKSLGVTPDFIVHHVYPQYNGPESDPLVLQSARSWASDAADLRQQLNDYLGTNGTNVEILATENNANSGAQGRQSTSMVNGLYLADSLSQVMKTEIDGFVWWDLRNGTDTAGSFDATLYGWRTVGDLGIMSGTSTYYPTYYTDKLMQYFVGTNDTILNPTSDYLLLSAYGALKADGSLALLVINKDTVTNFTAQINVSGFTPSGTATVRSFGVLQDEATRTNSTVPGAKDISTNSISNATNGFSYTFRNLTLTLITFTPSGSSPQATTLTLASGANPSTYGNTVTLTATVRTNGVAVGNISGETVTFYDGATQLGTGTLNVSGQAAYTTTATQLSAVTHSITAGYAGDVNYLGSTNSPALSQVVNQKTLTAALTGTVSKNYNGITAATLAAGNYTLPGVLGGDTVTLNNPTSGSYDTRNQGTGKTVNVSGLAISGASATNYTLASTSISGAVGTINKTNITVTASVNSKTYDGTITAAAAPVISLGSIQTGDSASFVEAYATRTAGTSKTLIPSGSITDGNSGNNYNLTFVNNTAGVIIARSLTVTASGVNKTYDGTVTATVTLADNRISGDVFTDSYTSAGFSNKHAGTGKTVNVSGISISGTDAPNYTLANTTASTTADIAALAITVTAAANSKPYDGTTSAAATPTVTSGSIQTGDAANFTETYDTASVGTGKTLTPAGSVTDGNSGNNYSVTFANNTTGVISARAVNLTGTRPYDGTTTAAAAILSVANKIGSEDVSVASGSGTLASPNVGLQSITSFGDLALGGADVGNYTLSGASGSVNITPGGLAVAVTNLLALDKVYDATTNATLDATNAGLDGVLNGDDVVLVSSNAVASFADKNVGTNKPVTVIGLALAGSMATNYALIDPTNLTAGITPVSLTISGVTADNKVFDGSTNATLSGTATLNAVIGSDDASLVTSNATAAFADPDVGTGKAVTVSGYAVAGADSGNYTLTQPEGLTADIVAVVTPTFVGQGISKVTGGWELTFSAQAGQDYKVLATEDLRTPLGSWTVLDSGTFGSGTRTFTDNSTNVPIRFYMIASP